MAKDIRNWLYLSCFIDLFGVSFIVPVLGMHLRSLGFSNSSIGIISSIYAAIQLFSGPIVGSWSDKYGRRPVLYFTLLICSLSYYVLGVTSSFGVIFFTRIVLGLMKHTQTICKTLVADVISSDKQTDIQGKLNGVASLGFMVGPIIGGHVAELENGFQYICYITSVMFLLNSLIVYFAFPTINKSLNSSSKSEHKSDSRDMTSSVYEIISDLFNMDWLNYWDIFSLKFLMGISMSVFYSNYSLYVVDTFNLTPKHMGYTFSFQGLVAAASGMQIEVFSKLYTDKSPNINYIKVYHCFFLLSFTLLAMYLFSNMYIFLALLLPLSGSSSLIRTITTEMLLERCEPGHRGSLMGTSNSVTSSTRMIVPLVIGFLQDVFHASSIMMVAGLMSVCGTYIAFVLQSDKRKKKTG